MGTAKKRPNFSETVVKTLFAFSNNSCGFIDIDSRGGCEEDMTDPKWKLVNGEIAHIRGWAPHSARYDGTMTDEQRNAFDNLLLLCPKHHKRVDRLEPERYTVSIMEEMKAMASGGNPTGRAWTSEANLVAFAKSAIEQAIEQVLGEEAAAENGAGDGTVNIEGRIDGGLGLGADLTARFGGTMEQSPSDSKTVVDGDGTTNVVHPISETSTQSTPQESGLGLSGDFSQPFYEGASSPQGPDEAPLSS